MKLLKTMRNYFFYCGIEKNEYEAIKKDAYLSNYRVWKILHFVMATIFGLLFLVSLFNSLMATNRILYLIGFLYSVAAIVFFFLLKEDSIAAQLLIYLSMSFLFLFGAFITMNKPENNATTFIVMLLITPMFMIDKPFFMTIELCVASAIFLIWMYAVKPIEVWRLDLVNVITYTVIGSFLNVIANSIRIKEFMLTREIRIQKDTDEMTGLRNKGALTREINAFLAHKSTGKGLLFMLDVDGFKSINDVYGHDVGDDVITQLGECLAGMQLEEEIIGRFGGDEFILFLKNTDDLDAAITIADDLIAEVSQSIVLPDKNAKVSISIGIAPYHGQENNYSELFKKADMALYRAKADGGNRPCVYE